MLVYLLLFAVALLCYDMLWYSWSGQRLQWSAPRYTLLTCANNIALPGLLYFYTLYFVSLHRILISIHFPLIYVIWWGLTHITRSYLCINGWQRCAFSFTTHTLIHTLKRTWHLSEDINTQTTSPELLWESLHERFIWVKLSSYHIHTEM